MVFASASFHDHTHYGSMALRSAWTDRILAYLISCVISMLLALRFHRRQRFAARRDGRASGSDESVTIQTSPYTESELPL